MRDVRRLMGILGLAILALGFYSLIEVIIGYANGYGFALISLGQFLTDIGLGAYLGTELMERLDDVPAFFSLAITGIIIAWWGLKPLPPKPKFRKG